jgi:hypothetical protein
MLEAEYSTDTMITQDIEETAISSSPLSDVLYSSVFIILTTIGFVLFCPELRHWFILPIVLCGIIIGTDAVKWFRGKYDIFDPKAVVGLLGVHFFYSSPILVAVWEIHTPLVAASIDDYRPYLGIMGILNFSGLLLYQITEQFAVRRPHLRPVKVWRPNPSRIVFVLTIFIAISLAAQIYSFARQGFQGIIGWTAAEREAARGGMGVFRMLRNSLPILLLILMTMLRIKGGITWRRSNIVVVALLMIPLGGFAFISSGLFGARSTTVWALLSLVGIIHYYWRPLSRKAVIIGLILLIMFMYFYSFYKKIGVDAWRIYQREGIKGLSAETGQTLRGIFVGDLSRADIQAYMVYVLTEKPYDYSYRWGKTFIGDFAVQFPRWIWLNEYNISGDSGKMKAGTDMMMAPGTYNPRDPWAKARWVYGLAGQAMLNFGIFAVPLGFIVWGTALGWYRRQFRSWIKGDTRFILVPIVTNIFFLILTSDFDNIINFSIFRFFIPFSAVWLISYRFYTDPVSQTHDFPDTEYLVNTEYRHT